MGAGCGGGWCRRCHAFHVLLRLPDCRCQFALIAYVTVALGGFGSLFGALVAGLLIGEVEALTAVLIEPSLKQVGMFAIYLAVLMFRPRGLFGTL